MDTCLICGFDFDVENGGVALHVPEQPGVVLNIYWCRSCVSRELDTVISQIKKEWA